MTRTFCDCCDQQINEKRPEFNAICRSVDLRQKLTSNVVKLVLNGGQNAIADFCIYCVIDAINRQLDNRDRPSIEAPLNHAMRLVENRISYTRQVRAKSPGGYVEIDNQIDGLEIALRLMKGEIES